MLVFIPDNKSIKGAQPEDVEVVKRAFQPWQEALGQRIQFVFVNNPAICDVRINWLMYSANVSKQTEEAGLNRVSYSGKFLRINDIELVRNDRNGNPYSLYALHSTALHEIGHMIGLRAHSDDPNDVMYPSSDDYQLTDYRGLTQRDINTIRQVYSAPADVSNPPGYLLSEFHKFESKQRIKTRLKNACQLIFLLNII